MEGTFNVNISELEVILILISRTIIHEKEKKTQNSHKP